MILRRSKIVINQSGATAIEFVLILLPLILVIVGTIETGRLFWTRNALNDVAVAGARCAGINAPACTGAPEDFQNTISFIQNAARGRALLLAASDISVSRLGSCGASENFVTVDISFTFRWVIGLQTELSVQACHVIQPLPPSDVDD